MRGVQVRALLGYCGEKFELSPIFILDLISATAYVLMTVYLFYMSPRTVHAIVELKLIAIIVLAANFTKIAFLLLIERRGADSRTFRRSLVLVTDGVYRYSRNPVYLTTFVQNLLWSLVLLFRIIDRDESRVVIAVVAIVPLIHFVGVNWLVIPKEEADLLQLHPITFSAYAKSVHRWVGRRIA